MTTDIWTSDNNTGYMIALYNFLIKQGMHSHVLLSDKILGQHTAEILEIHLVTFKEKWDVDNKVVTVISYNGSNIKYVIQDILKNLHQPCVAYTLNLLVNECLKMNEELSIVLKRIQTFNQPF